MTEVSVTPSILTWARNGVALSPEEAARRLGVPPERLVRWEQDEERPTKTHVRHMAQLYKRPLAVFFMKSPPPSHELPEDFRTVGGRPAPLSRELVVAVRQVRAWQSVLARLGEVAEPTARKMRVPVVTADDNTERIGRQTRELLRVPLDVQLSFATPEEALNYWRESVEELGVAVFAIGLDRRLCRGFSLWAVEAPPVIALAREAPQARIFTLMHELTHLMIRSGAMCLEREDESERGRVEKFCNRVAAATLMPRSEFVELARSMSGDEHDDWTFERVKKLADTLKVSVPATALRLQETELVEPGFYEEVVSSAESEFEPKGGGGGGGISSWPGVRVGERGTTYSSLVFDAWIRGRISLGDASRVMNVKPKYVPLIGQSVINRRRRFG